MLLVEDKSMVAMVDFIARSSERAGLLNPSDWQALRHGFVGVEGARAAGLTLALPLVL